MESGCGDNLNIAVVVGVGTCLHNDGCVILPWIDPLVPDVAWNVNELTGLADDCFLTFLSHQYFEGSLDHHDHCLGVAMHIPGAPCSRRQNNSAH